MERKSKGVRAMTGPEALVACVINGEKVRQPHWDDDTYTYYCHGSFMHSGGALMSAEMFRTSHHWEVYPPDETCSFVELFDKLKPGDWATTPCSFKEYFIDEGGYLKSRYNMDNPEETANVWKDLANATFIIHRG